MIGSTEGVQRGCGQREQGAVYLETGLDPDGAEVWEFLVDPPHPFSIDAKLGQELIEVDGTAHVFDWIGQKHYPWPCDFVEEIRRHGLSRRVSRNFDFDRLTRGSRVFCIHGRALYEGHPIQEPKDFEAETRCGLHAQEGDESHLKDRRLPCTRKWWWAATPDVEGSTTRSVGDVTYEYVEGVKMPDPEPAIFAAFPISNLTVIRAKDGSHEDTYDEVREVAPSDIPVTISQA